MRHSILLGLLLLSVLAKAQVTTDPAFFTDTDSVTIYYDATQGTSNLIGANSVYIHTGVITSGASDTSWEYVVGNWGAANGLGKMTKVEGEANIWSFTLVPRTYYNVPEGTPIFRMGMVFREEGPCSTCAEGKSDSNSDIFVDLWDGSLEARLLQPTTSPVVIDAGQEVTFEAQFSKASTWQLSFGDGTDTTHSELGTTLGPLTHTYSETGTYTYTLAFEAADEESSTYEGTVVVRGESPQAALPTGMQKGINYHAGTDSVTLVLWAPEKSSAYVLGDFNNWALTNEGQMNWDADEEVFWVTLSGLDEGVEYGYQYLIDESIYIADPYADKILDPDDQYIPESIYANLKEYPTEAENPTWYFNRVSVLELGQTPYAWQSTDYQRPDKENLVIYELLVRDFLGQDEGSYQALIDTIGYLERLGVNAIELMPVMEFNGNDSWGYNPTFMFAVDKYYGTRNGLKSFIDTCHARGIAVILDMVMNQNDIPAPFAALYWDAANSTPTSDNPWFNQVARHPFNVFFDIDHESEYTQEWLDTVNAYWLTEYQFDGFRFDLSKGFTQTQYGDDVGAWNSFDQGRVNTLKRMADEIWAVDPTAYIILEHFANNDEETDLANYGMMLWGNAHGQFKEANLGFADNNSIDWAYAQERGWNDNHLVSYMESHDEERQMYDMINFGESEGAYDVQDEATAIDRLKMSATFFFPIPGPKMLWQFGEFAYDVPINENGRTGRKPTKWEYLEEENKADLLEVYSTIIQLKVNHPAFAEGTFAWQPDDEYKTWTITHDSTDFHALANYGLEEATVNPGFPKLGFWYDVFTGDTILVDDNTQTVTLAPGEFHLFANDAIYAEELGLTTGSLADEFPAPDDVDPTPTGFEVSDFTDHWSLYPNPTNGSVTLKAHFPSRDRVQIEIFDIFGARKSVYANVLVQENGRFSLDVDHLMAGMYILRIQQGETVSATRFLKN
ncbi:MAG: alpha-amylase family glycosyl hydrolase [Bacteroidota bacterium]